MRLRQSFGAPLAAVFLGLTGCASSLDGDDSAGAECPRTGPLNSPALVLVAQAVPSATQLPCIRDISAGWDRKPMVVRNGRAEFPFSSDREGSRAFTVVLTKSCDHRGASRVPSDQPGTRRYELPTRVASGYAGSRFYVFPGGCITYRFDLTGTTRAQGVTEAAGLVGFTTRTAIGDMVRRHSDGRLRLDAAPRNSKSPVR